MSITLLPQLTHSASSSNESQQTIDEHDTLDALAWNMPSAELQQRFPLFRSSSLSTGRSIQPRYDSHLPGGKAMVQQRQRRLNQ